MARRRGILPADRLAAGVETWAIDVRTGVLSMGIQISTRLVPIPAIGPFDVPSPLGPLSPLTGLFDGDGFNQIFRPFNGAGSDNFLELNLTHETIEFTQIPGEIPNRGFGQVDVSLFGITYLQQVQDKNVKDTNGNPAGIHIEPGIWLNIPATTVPGEPATVARLANIPHGTSLVAQGTATQLAGPLTAQSFPPVDITPFFIGQPAHKQPFPSQNLATPSPFRSPASDIVGITQPMLENPNSFLATALGGKAITSTTVLDISTRSGGQDPGGATTVAEPDTAGGVSEIAFLDGPVGGGRPNALVHSMSATFWISDFTDAFGPGLLLQYSQVVLLNFGPLSWPHVSVASLVNRPPKSAVKDHKPEIKDTKPEIKDHKAEIKDTKPEIKDHKPEFPEHKPTIQESQAVSPFPPFPIPPDPGPAGPAAPAPAAGRHFIAAEERPAVSPPDVPAPPADAEDGPPPENA